MVLAVQVAVQTVVDVQVGVAAEQTEQSESKVSAGISLGLVPALAQDSSAILLASAHFSNLKVSHLKDLKVCEIVAKLISVPSE